MDTKYIPNAPRTFHIHHPWARQPTDDLTADYNNFQDVVNASINTLKTARLASVRGHVLGKAWILHPPGTDSPSRQLFPEGDKTGHEQPEANKFDPSSYTVISRSPIYPKSLRDYLTVCSHYTTQVFPCKAPMPPIDTDPPVYTPSPTSRVWFEYKTITPR
eukprot:499046-Prorocentrum_minimum.AAC.4